MEKYSDEQYDLIEKEIECGQIEDLLQHAKGEFELIDTLKGTPLDEPAQMDWRDYTVDPVSTKPNE